ncbi:hypothetical protein SADUNF_Sadunf05G0133800 [Salix dunnii]|uniref:Uncharacterized protein n=1 Tax=Salix dunnii TaxID=1413687 RepID=A0A835KCW1_9ROSI|nr:hypothetical protein SADUNF_Sadunf05G0133800 [Salix dunnii]
MGCCISKWRAKKRSIECYHDIHVVDRLAIPPKTPKIAIPVSNKISPSPPSPTTSASSSLSSFTCTNSNTTAISSCSSLSSGYSILSSKDRSFSNEFLWSCVKENPHIIRSSSSKKRSQLLVSPNVCAKKLDLPPKQVVAPFQQSIPQETLRSPSPSGRFTGDSGRGILTALAKESHSKRMVGTMLNSANSMRKEKLGLTSSYINSSQHRSCLRNRETCIHRTRSKLDEVAVDEAVAHQNNDSIPMADIDNPLISLDCFIFL